MDKQTGSRADTLFQNTYTHTRVCEFIKKAVCLSAVCLDAG